MKIEKIISQKDRKISNICYKGISISYSCKSNYK